MAGMILASNLALAGITYPDQGFLKKVDPRVFDLLDMRIGTVTEAEVNSKAKIPGLRVVVDFGGKEFDELKQSSAQLRDNYLSDHEAAEEMKREKEDTVPGSLIPKAKLGGQQIAAVTNFPARSVGIRSYFLTLGVVSLTGESTGTVVIRPLLPCLNGSKVKLLNDNEPSSRIKRTEETSYEQAFHPLDIRVGTVISVKDETIDFGAGIGTFTYSGDYPLFVEGLQVLRVINLDQKDASDNFLGVVDDSKTLIPLTLERPMPNGRFLK